MSSESTCAHLMPRTVFAASCTARSAALAKLSLEVPITSIIFCVIPLSWFPVEIVIDFARMLHRPKHKGHAELRVALMFPRASNLSLSAGDALGRFRDMLRLGRIDLHRIDFSSIHLPGPRIDLHRRQNLLQPGKHLVEIDRLNPLLGAVSSRTQPQYVFVTRSIFVVVVVLRGALRQGAARETRCSLHVARADFNFLGVHRLSVGIARVDEGKVLALLLGNAAIDVYIEEGRREVGAGIRTTGR